MSLTENKVNLDDKGVWSISVKAKKPFEVQGEPWMDETSSFYLADVELVDSRKELELDDDVLEEAQAMSESIPELVEEWLKLVLSTGASDVEGMSKIMKVCERVLYACLASSYYSCQQSSDNCLAFSLAHT